MIILQCPTNSRLTCHHWGQAKLEWGSFRIPPLGVSGLDWRDTGGIPDTGRETLPAHCLECDLAFQSLQVWLHNQAGRWPT